MTDHIKQIEELIAAGEQATQGCLYLFCAHPGNNNNEYRIARPGKSKGYYQHVEITAKEREGNQNFLTKAANARPAIKAMLEENKRLREALQLMSDNIGAVSLSRNTLGKEIRLKARKALGASDE